MASQQLNIIIDGTREVIFNLKLPHQQAELPISLMLTRNYSRNDIVACFEELERLGYGIYDRGKQGKGHYGRFFPNEKMPQSYSMQFEVKRHGKARKTIEAKCK